MIKIIKTSSYKYLVSVKEQPNKYPQCKWPREKPNYGSYRSFSKIYISPDGSKKEIIYPKDLWFTKIKESDKFETEIIDIKNDWPNWYLIQVF
jgi:hypothetical protein